MGLTESELSTYNRIRAKSQDALSTTIKISYTQVLVLVIDELKSKYKANAKRGNQERVDAFSKVLRYYLDEDEMNEFKAQVDGVKPLVGKRSVKLITTSVNPRLSPVIEASIKTDVEEYHSHDQNWQWHRWAHLFSELWVKHWVMDARLSEDQCFEKAFELIGYCPERVSEDNKPP